MTRKTSTIPPQYFEEKYRADIDPWKFRTSEYERDKYQATLDCLGQSTYANALEVGCSIGELTKRLSPRCKRLLAIDASETAINAARMMSERNVSLRVATIPADFPKGKFDLILLSELLYYFELSDLERVARSCVNAASPGSEIVLCHWLGETNYPLTGLEASEAFAKHIKPTMTSRTIFNDAVYRLEKFSMA